MKKFQKLMGIVAIVNFVLWICLGIISFLCMPSSVNDLGRYSDEYDGVTVEDLQTFAPEALKPAVVVYQPLCWLMEPESDGQSGWFAVTGLLGLAVAYLLFKRIPNQSDTSSRHNGVKYAIDIALNLYLIGFVTLIIHGIVMYVVQ